MVGIAFHTERTIPSKFPVSWLTGKEEEEGLAVLLRGSGFSGSFMIAQL